MTHITPTHTPTPAPTHTHHSLCCMPSCCDTTRRLAELEQCAQEGRRLNANQWLPCKEASHNVLLQQRKLKLWSLHHLQQAWREGHVPLWCGGSIIRRRLITAADQLQKVMDTMEAVGRETFGQTLQLPKGENEAVVPHLLNFPTMQLESLTSEGYTLAGSSGRRRARGACRCA